MTKPSDTDEIDPADSSTAAEGDQTPTETADNQTDDRSTEDESQITAREAMIRKLTGEADDDATDGDATETRADPADAGTDQERPDETPRAEDPPRKSDDGGAQAQPDADLRIPDEEWKPLKARTKQRIEKFRAELRETRPLAAMAREQLKFLKTAGIRPEDYEVWMRAGAIVNRGGQEAIDALLDMARQLGYRPESAETEADGADEAGTEDGPKTETPAALPAWLKAKVDKFEISEDAARDIAARLAETAANKGKKPPARQQPTARRPATSQDPQTQPAARREQDDSAQRAQARLTEKIAGAKAKYGSQWAVLYPMVRERLVNLGATDPEAIANGFDLALEAAVARVAQPVKRPQGGLSEGNPRKADANLTPRQRMVARLTR
jgi:hypothetical protein